MTDRRIAIIGAGPGGMGMAIKLLEAGYSNFTIYEKSDQLGGTWNHNRYPGCACDIQSQLYSYSFEINRSWTRPYARQPEILAYLQYVASKYELAQHFRFDTELEAATWDESTAKWSLRFATGLEDHVDIVVSAIGMFNELAYPDIKGLDDFSGPSFHSARWDWDHDLSGRTVGVIGSAASAVQFVPEIRKLANQVHLFQRTPNWVLPKEDTPYTNEEIGQHQTNLDALPRMREALFLQVDNGTAFTNDDARISRERIVLDEIAKVGDPELRKRLTPDHPWGCKRPLFSNDYYPAFNESNLELVTDPIDYISPAGVLTADGIERSVDTLIHATGFQTTKFLSSLDVQGRAGIRNADAWNDGAQAHMGVTTAGFPNLFMLYGPNTNNGSLITMIEYQIDNIVQHVQRLDRENLSWVEVKHEAMDQYNEEIQTDLEKITSWHAGCNGYYRSPNGRIVTQWPNSMADLGRRLETMDETAFNVGYRRTPTG
jgi:cation diffusion facilitator CzcD-associated flavoprotein CzcO